MSWLRFVSDLINEYVMLCYKLNERNNKYSETNDTSRHNIWRR